MLVPWLSPPPLAFLEERGSRPRRSVRVPGPAFSMPGCGRRKLPSKSGVGSSRFCLGTFKQRGADGTAWSCPECGGAQAPANSCPQTHLQRQRRVAEIARGSCRRRLSSLRPRCAPLPGQPPSLGKRGSQPRKRSFPWRKASTAHGLRFQSPANRGGNCFTHPSPLPPRCRPRGPQPGWLVSTSGALSGLRRGGGFLSFVLREEGAAGEVQSPRCGPGSWGATPSLCPLASSQPSELETRALIFHTWSWRFRDGKRLARDPMECEAPSEVRKNLELQSGRSAEEKRWALGWMNRKGSRSRRAASSLPYAGPVPSRRLQVHPPGARRARARAAEPWRR